MIEGTREMDAEAPPVARPPVSAGSRPPPSGGRRAFYESGELLVLGVSMTCLLLIRIGSEWLSSEFLKSYIADYIWVAVGSFFVYLFFDQLLTLGVLLAGYWGRQAGTGLAAARPLRGFGVTLLATAVIVAVAGPVSADHPLYRMTDSTHGVPFAGTLLDPRALLAAAVMCLWTVAYRSTRWPQAPQRKLMGVPDDDDGSVARGNTGAAARRGVDRHKRLFRQIGWTLNWAFGASLVLGGGVAARVAPAWVSQVRHETDRDQQAYALTDGTVVTLDAYSQFEARVSPFGREIHLSKGQALIEIDRNWGQPFRVFAGSKGIAAEAAIVGGPDQAAFVVKVVAPDVMQVMPIQTASLDIVYPSKQGRPGDQVSWDTLYTSVHTVVVIDSRRPALKHISQAEQVARLGWLSGQVVFSNTPLEAAVAEMNRYSGGRPIVLSDPSLADVPISGTFEEDVSVFAANLKRACIVKIGEGGGDPYAPYEITKAAPDCAPEPGAMAK